MSNRKDGQGKGLRQADASHADLADTHSGEGSVLTNADLEQQSAESNIPGRIRA